MMAWSWWCATRALFCVRLLRAIEHTDVDMCSTWNTPDFSVVIIDVWTFVPPRWSGVAWIGIKYPWPGGEGLLHVMVCSKSLASQVLLNEFEQMEITGWGWKAGSTDLSGCLLSRDTNLKSAICQTVAQWWSGVYHLLPTRCVCVGGRMKLSALGCLLRHCLRLSCTYVSCGDFHCAIGRFGVWRLQ